MKKLLICALLLTFLVGCGNTPESKTNDKYVEKLDDECVGGLVLKLTLKNPLPDKMKVIVDGDHVIIDECKPLEGQDYKVPKGGNTIFEYNNIYFGGSTNKDVISIQVFDQQNCISEKEIYRIQNHPVPIEKGGGCSIGRVDITEN